MAWPIVFNSLTNPQSLQDFDTMFNAVAGVISIPSTASGTNAISLSPVTNSPALPAYTELCGARFRAVGNSSGPVTAQINGLGLLPVYHADGLTQASSGDLLTGEQYVVIFSQSLNGGAGGFFLESPSLAVVTQPWLQPGGRLTLVSATPVMTATVTNQQIIYYAPYKGPFVAIYNGANVQNYQFTSSLADQVGLQLNMGGGAQWTANFPFDVFVYVNAGVPSLCAIKWANNTTRATTLSVFGGFLTNTGAATAFTGPATSFTLPANQGTYVGTIYTTNAGQSQWQFGSPGAPPASANAASFLVFNYYNPILVNTAVSDTAASYTYSSATARVARGNATFQINWISGASENAGIFKYESQCSLSGGANAFVLIGLGFNQTAAFNASALYQNSSAVAQRLVTFGSFSGTGFLTVSAMEQSDGTNANSFDTGSNGTLTGAIWL